MTSENELNPNYTETGFITCPFDEVHRIEPPRLAYHITKCMEQNPEKMKVMTQCKFNVCHIIHNHEYAQHLRTCPDRPIETDIPVDVELSAENMAFEKVVIAQGPNNHGWLAEASVADVPAEHFVDQPILRPFSGASRAVRKRNKRQQRLLFNNQEEVLEEASASQYYTTNEWDEETEEAQLDPTAPVQGSHSSWETTTNVVQDENKTTLPSASNTPSDPKKSNKQNTRSWSNVLNPPTVRNENLDPRQSESSNISTIPSNPNPTTSSSLSYAMMANKQKSGLYNNSNNTDNNKPIIRESDKKDDSRRVINSKQVAEKVSAVVEESMNEITDQFQNVRVVEKEEFTKVSHKKGKKKKTKFVPFNLD